MFAIWSTIIELVTVFFGFDTDRSGEYYRAILMEKKLLVTSYQSVKFIQIFELVHDYICFSGKSFPWQ